jgi:hypothetical protein
MENRKYILVGNQKHYYTERVEPVTFTCPVRGEVTVDFPVKYFDPVNVDGYGNIIIDAPIIDLANTTESLWD